MGSDLYSLCYIVAPDPPRALAWEMAILSRFIREHGQPPAENRSVTFMSDTDVAEAISEMSQTEPEWPGNYEWATCDRCGCRGRVALAGGNDPFYNEPYLYVDGPGHVCGQNECNDD